LGLPARRSHRHITAMTEPLVVVIPHRLGKDEAARRIRDGFARAKGEFAHLIRIDNDTWEGDRLAFAAAALGQHAHGFIDVYDGAVRLEVTLPWLLAHFAHAVQRVVGQRGVAMLGKK
jgi:Putative polyhydroxyalkanoic acid system protein (PHA_gran_rgn)